MTTLQIAQIFSFERCLADHVSDYDSYLTLFTCYFFDALSYPQLKRHHQQPYDFEAYSCCGDLSFSSCHLHLHSFLEIEILRLCCLPFYEHPLEHPLHLVHHFKMRLDH